MDEIEALGAAIHQQMLRDRENKRQTDRDARLAAAEELLRETIPVLARSSGPADAIDRISAFLSGKTNEGSGG